MEGDVVDGTIMAGQVASIITCEQSCHEIIQEIMDQTNELLNLKERMNS